MARGHLARRVVPANLVPTVLDLCGVHAQLASTVPLTLAARVSGLTQARIDAALRERVLVKTWGMRGTLHVFAAEDLPLYCAAQHTRDQYNNAAFLKAFELDLADVEAVLDAIPRALDGQMLTRDELAARILAITKRKHLEQRLRSGWGELLKPAAFRGLLCFGQQTGRNVTFVRPDQWLGGWHEHDPEEALQEAFRRFLATYGPATREEIARWWGVRPPEAGRVVKLIRESLDEVDVEGSKRWMLAGEVKALRDAEPPTGVRLLPSFDQLLVMSAPQSEAIVDAAFQDRVYRQRVAVWSLPALLADGRLRATWTLERKRDRAVLKVTPFAAMGSAWLTALDEEAETVGEAIGLPTRLELGG